MTKTCGQGILSPERWSESGSGRFIKYSHPLPPVCHCLKNNNITKEDDGDVNLISNREIPIHDYTLLGFIKQATALVNKTCAFVQRLLEALKIDLQTKVG